MHDDESIESVKFLIKKYLPTFKFKVKFSRSTEIAFEKYDLVVLWNFHRKLEIGDDVVNVVVFHASNLPEGRGWAPIANLFLHEQKQYTLTGFRANSEIDTGNILIQFYISMKPSYTARFIRLIDNELMCLGVRMLLDYRLTMENGRPQPSNHVKPFQRRTPEMNKIDVSNSIESYIALLKSAEEGHPVYFEHDGEVFDLCLTPRKSPNFPEVLVSVFYDRERVVKYTWELWMQKLEE